MAATVWRRVWQGTLWGDWEQVGQIPEWVAVVADLLRAPSAVSIHVEYRVEKP